MTNQSLAKKLAAAQQVSDIWLSIVEITKAQEEGNFRMWIHPQTQQKVIVVKDEDGEFDLAMDVDRADEVIVNLGVSLESGWWPLDVFLGFGMGVHLPAMGKNPVEAAVLAKQIMDREQGVDTGPDSE